LLRKNSAASLTLSNFWGCSKERGALYGMISIVVAVLAGLGIDFIVRRLFKKRVATH